MPLSIIRPRLPPISTAIARTPDSGGDPFYASAEWRALTGRVRRSRPRRCEGCGKTHEDDGAPVALIADHVTERRDGGADLDPGNVRLLCARAGGDGRPHANGQRGGCHARKTRAARVARDAS